MCRSTPAATMSAAKSVRMTEGATAPTGMAIGGRKGKGQYKGQDISGQYRFTDVFVNSHRRAAATRTIQADTASTAADREEAVTLAIVYEQR